MNIFSFLFDIAPYCAAGSLAFGIFLFLFYFISRF